jgi:hypothetical protein
MAAPTPLLWMVRLGESSIEEVKHYTFAAREMTVGEVWACVHSGGLSRFTRSRL